jgi:hypothetical protein
MTVDNYYGDLESLERPNPHTLRLKRKGERPAEAKLGIEHMYFASKQVVLGDSIWLSGGMEFLSVDKERLGEWLSNPGEQRFDAGEASQSRWISIEPEKGRGIYAFSDKAVQPAKVHIKIEPSTKGSYGGFMSAHIPDALEDPVDAETGLEIRIAIPQDQFDRIFEQLRVSCGRSMVRVELRTLAFNLWDDQFIPATELPHGAKWMWTITDPDLAGRPGWPTRAAKCTRAGRPWLA